MNIGTVEDFIQIADENKESLCLSDGSRIVYANKLWLDSYKYTTPEIQGQTFKLLQGPKSDFNAVKSLMEAAESRKTFQGTLTNYTSDGIVVKDTVTVIPALETHFIVKSSVKPLE